MVEHAPVPAEFFDPDLPDETWESHVKEYLEKTKEAREKEAADTNLYIGTKREISRARYSEMQQENIVQYGITENQILYVSQYAPMVLAEIPVQKVYEIAKCETVTAVDLLEEREGVDATNATALKSVDADYTRNTLGFTGCNVNIGQIELATPDKTHNDLKSPNIKVLIANTGSHATGVARILVGKKGIAPDARLVSVPRGSSYSDFYARIESLISYRNATDNSLISVINASTGWERAANEWYRAAEKWLDHVAPMHSVSVVVSAGNIVSTGIDVLEPGLAYNVITAGGFVDNNSTNPANYALYAESAYANGGSSGCAKPDLLAPAANVLGDGVEGTSSSAPVVSGIIAQMLELKPSLANNPTLIKAILLAGCAYKFSGETLAGGLTPEQGAGTINAKRAIYVASGNRYLTGTISASGTKNHTFAVTSGDAKIRVALTWTIKNTVSGAHGSGGTVTVPLRANLGLQVYKPNGSLAAQKNLQNSSAELVHMEPPTIGQNKITVLNYTATSASYVVAWY